MRIRAIREDTPEGVPEADPIVDKTLNTVEACLERARKILGDGFGLTPCTFVTVYRSNSYQVGDVVWINDSLGGGSGFAQIDSIEPQIEKSSDGGLKTTLQLGLLRLPYEFN